MIFNNIKIYLIIVLVIVVAAAGYFLYKLNWASQPKITACTMEAKICPNGAAVGRTGPNCEFAECPILKQSSGIKGIAMLGPMCPIEKNPPDPNCADKPYKTTLVAVPAGRQASSPDEAQIFKEFNSNADGKFIVDLSEGEYVISSADTAGIFSHCSSRGSVKVEKNKYTDITIYCDTGIR